MLNSSSIRVQDRGFARLRDRLGKFIAGRDWDEDAKSVVEVKGWVNVVMRERGKIVPGSRREGHNVWTNTGKEFIPMLMSLTGWINTSFRSDRVAYIGVGDGMRIEEPSVSSLASPLPYNLAGDLFLARLDLNTDDSFPLAPLRTVIRYHRTFLENEITPDSDIVQVSEFGLFTNGNALTYVVGEGGTGRDISLANASLQAPVAYKAIEAVGKTNNLRLEVSWEIRL